MIQVVLLAAGQSQRFGGAKLMQPLPSGVWVGVQSAALYRHLGLPVLAVVREEHLALQQQLQTLGVKRVIHPDPNAGMGTSLALGVQQSSDADGWLIALADMPFIQAQSIRALVKTLHSTTDKCMVAPFYQGQRGHPVGFSQEYGESLRRLTGDQGASSIIKAEQVLLRSVDVSDAGVVQDIDYPTDLVSEVVR